MSFVTLSAVSILIGIFHIGNFCFWVPFLKKLLLRNYVVDFVEICSVCARKAIIEAAKRIINSDKVCHSYSDLNFGVTFFGTQCSVQWMMIIRSSQTHLHDLLPSLSSVLVEQLFCHHHHHHHHHHHRYHHQIFHRTLDKSNQYTKQCTKCVEMRKKRNRYYENVGVTCKIHVDQCSV